MYLTLTCFFLPLIGLLLVFRDDVVAKASSSAAALFLFVPIAFVVFSLRQYENMLSGFQVAFGLVQAFSVLALCLLYFSRHEGLRKFTFPAALGSGTVATFSGAQGLFVWPVGLLQLLLSPVEKPTKKWLIGAWSLIGLGEWIVYFVGYTSSGPSSLDYVPERPAVVAEYFLTSLGSALFWQQAPAFFVGLLLVCLAAAGLVLVYRDGKLGENSFWVALLSFSFLTLASVALGRSGEYGVAQALQSKYTSFSLLAVIGAYAVFVKLMLERRSYLTAGLLGVLSASILLSVPVHYLSGIAAGRDIEAEREELAYVLSTYESQPDEALEEIRHNPDWVRKQARMLERRDYNVFSEP